MNKWKDLATIGLVCLICIGLLFGSTDLVVTTQAGFYGNLDTTEYSWYFNPREDGIPPEGCKEATFYKNYNAYYLGDSSEKSLYITFDAGYENGCTEQILDVLKKHNAPAAFFLVGHYITSNPELVKRMEREGHLVCNHTVGHKDLATLTNFEEFKEEVVGLEELYQQTVGKEMPKFARPPEGRFSEMTLKYLEELGYTTVFWSFAYEDWLNDKQPDPQASLEKILSRTHPGGIMLFHSTSQTNVEIFDQLLTKWEEMGYTFKSLTQLPAKEKANDPQRAVGSGDQSAQQPQSGLEANPSSSVQPSSTSGADVQESSKQQDQVMSQMEEDVSQENPLRPAIDVYEESEI